MSNPRGPQEIAQCLRLLLSENDDATLMAAYNLLSGEERQRLLEANMGSIGSSFPKQPLQIRPTTRDLPGGYWPRPSINPRASTNLFVPTVRATASTGSTPATMPEPSGRAEATNRMVQAWRDMEDVILVDHHSGSEAESENSTCGGPSGDAV